MILSKTIAINIAILMTIIHLISMKICLKTRSIQIMRIAKNFLITNQKGGVGKSTLTYNLAQNIANKAKVAVIDFDLQGNKTSYAHIGQHSACSPEYVEEVDQEFHLGSGPEE